MGGCKRGVTGESTTVFAVGSDRGGDSTSVHLLPQTDSPFLAQGVRFLRSSTLLQALSASARGTGPINGVPCDGGACHHLGHSEKKEIFVRKLQTHFNKDEQINQAIEQLALIGFGREL